MSQANVGVYFTGDSERFDKVMNRLLADQQKLLDKYSKLTGASKQASEEELRALAVKKRVAEQEKQNQAIEEQRRKILKGHASAVKDIAQQYFGLQAVMATINGLAGEFDQIQQSTLSKTQQLAAAQQETIKNLQGMTFLEKKELLTGTVRDIQSQTGFAGQSQITSALGSSISAGASVEEARSAVTVAAKFNKHTPENLVSAASALVDIGRATGIKDAEKNQAFLLKVGAVSRTEDPAQLARSLGESLGNIIKTLPNAANDMEKAAREAGALYATFNQESNDVTGRSTSTASIQFAAYLRKFFSEDGKAKESGIKDPGDLSGRIVALQQSKELQKEFLKGMPGEAAFKLPMEKMLESGSSVFERFGKSVESIDFDPKATREAADQIASATSTLSMSDIGVRSKATIEGFDLSPESQAKSQIEEIAKDTLPRVRSGGLLGIAQFTIQNVADPLRQGAGGSAQGLAAYRVEQLRERRVGLEMGGVDSSEKSKIELIDQQIQAIQGIITRLEKETASKSLNLAADKLDKAAANMQQQNQKGNVNAARAQAATVQ